MQKRYQVIDGQVHDLFFNRAVRWAFLPLAIAAAAGMHLAFRGESDVHKRTGIALFAFSLGLLLGMAIIVLIHRTYINWKK